MEGLYSISYRDLMAESNGLGNKIFDETDKHGYLLIHDVNFDVTKEASHKQELLDFCKHLGDPIPHNSMPNSFVWDIKPVKDSKNTFVTHSELDLEAELHTDSSFVDNPEDYFCLYSIKKSVCNGGESLLLSKDDLLKELRKTETGIKAEEVFKTKKFPFAVPTVFKEGHELQDENLYAQDYILTGDGIRFRSDVIEKVLQFAPQLIDAEQLEALGVLQRILEHSTAVKRFLLEEGDLVMINNKTMLHGRTAFNDSNRHLLRVRIRCNENLMKK
jgi:hypothetical protein